MRILLILPLLFLPPLATATPAQVLDLAAFRNNGPAPTPLVILGTFHFKDAGLDSYKPEVDIDILSPERQSEIADITARLAAFGPKKIALEAQGERAVRLQQEYQRYLEDDFELGANEIYQLGFRLAKQLGHERLYFVDAWGRRYELGEREETLAACGQSENDNNTWNDRYFALYRHDDKAKASVSLKDTLIYINSEERLLAGHGHYLVDNFHIGCGEDYFGADNVTGWWYNRNLRIFANLGRVRSPGEPLLLIIGAGHVPIIRHAAQASPEYRLVEVSDVLDSM